MTGASDWFQRSAAAIVTSPEALKLLAERGRTRRVRNAASRQLRHRDQPSITAFRDTARLFPLFGLPDRLSEEAGLGVPA
ncbi:hypothetical protein [Streptomyces sp. SYSU K21746]